MVFQVNGFGQETNTLVCKIDAHGFYKLNLLEHLKILNIFY